MKSYTRPYRCRCGFIPGLIALSLAVPEYRRSRTAIITRLSGPLVLIERSILWRDFCCECDHSKLVIDGSELLGRLTFATQQFLPVVAAILEHLSSKAQRLPSKIIRAA